MKKVLIGCGCLLLLVALGVVAAAVGIIFWTAPAATTATPPTRGPAPTGPAVVVTVAPAGGPITIEVGEAELTREITARLGNQVVANTPAGDARVETLTVSFQGGTIAIAGTARVGPLPGPFSVVARPGVDGRGVPTVNITEARVAGIPMPEAARTQVERTLQAEISSQAQASGMRVESIQAEGGKLRIVGRR